MKRRLWVVFWAGALAWVTGCQSRGPITTTVALAGPVGSPVGGYYVECGQQIPFRSVLPFEIQREGISEIEIEKSNPDETVVLVAQSDRHGWHSEINSTAGPGATGFRVSIHEGLNVEKTLRCAPQP